MQRRHRLPVKLIVAFVIGFAVAVLWMYGILHTSGDAPVAMSMPTMVLMFITAPPFLLSYTLGGMVFSVPFLNGIFYAGLAYLWIVTRKASRRRRTNVEAYLKSGSN